MKRGKKWNERGGVGHVTPTSRKRKGSQKFEKNQKKKKKTGEMRSCILLILSASLFFSLSVRCDKEDWREYDPVIGIPEGSHVKIDMQTSKFL
jgi:hypothetical protein